MDMVDMNNVRIILIVYLLCGLFLKVNVCCHCSEQLSRLAARKYARIIQKLGFPVSVNNQCDFELLNVTLFLIN